MLLHPTLDLLNTLGLTGMAKGLQDLDAQPEARTFDHTEWLALLLECEVTVRRQKRYEHRSRAARLRHDACLEDVDYQARAGSTAACSSSSAHATGFARTVICSSQGRAAWAKASSPALGQKACREDLSVAYHRASRLFAMLTLGRSDGRYTKMLRALSRTDLLIIDDWGPEALNAGRRRDLLEIVEDRYDRGSILITSQVPVDRWYEIIGSPTLADAILDRVVHNAYRIDLAGESLRKRHAPTLDA